MWAIENFLSAQHIPYQSALRPCVWVFLILFYVYSKDQALVNSELETINGSFPELTCLMHFGVNNLHNTTAKLENPLCYYMIAFNHDDVIKWKHFRVTGHLCEEFIGEFPAQMASNAELWCFLWSASE